MTWRQCTSQSKIPPINEYKVRHIYAATNGGALKHITCFNFHFWNWKQRPHSQAVQLWWQSAVAGKRIHFAFETLVQPSAPLSIDVYGVFSLRYLVYVCSTVICALVCCAICPANDICFWTIDSWSPPTLANWYLRQYFLFISFSVRLCRN